MEVNTLNDENYKKNQDNLISSIPEGPLLGSFTTNALDKDEKGMQIRSSARVFKKMKLEQELDRKNEEKNSLDVTSNHLHIEINSACVNVDHAGATLSDKLVESEVKGPHIRTSTRVVKKTKQDVTSANTLEGKTKKEDGKTDGKKVVRTNWSYEDKLMFFEAINEYGKDFENIQQHINNKLKKKGATDEQIRTKDHVRQFYNRTFHEVSKHVKFSDRVKKVVQELYGVINYGELHKKLGSVSEKACMRLNELIYRGATVIRLKGRNVRIKTPMCRALIKLNQLDEKYEDVKLPNRVTVELRPKDMTSYLRIQCMAQNPRLRTALPLQKRLSSLIQCLSKRWKTVDALNYQKSIISTNPVTNDYVPPIEESVEKNNQLSPPLRLSPPPEIKIELPLINLSDYLTRQTICLSAYERRLGLDTFSDIKLMSKRKKQKLDTEQKSENTTDIKNDYKIETMKTEEAETNSCNEADQDASLADVVDDAVNTILSLQQRIERQSSETSEAEEVKVETTKEEKQHAMHSELNKETEEKISNIRKGWTEKESCSLTIGEIYLMYGSDATLILEYSWDTEVKEEINKTLKNDENFLERWKESYEQKLESKRREMTTALSKLLSLAKLKYRNNVVKCPCGHVCNGKAATIKNQTVVGPKLKRNTIVDNNPTLSDLQQDENILVTVVPTNQQPMASNFTRTPVYIQPKGPAFHTTTMQQQLNSIQRLKPKFCNRKGRRPRSKQVVVERKLPLLPNNISGHQIVRMSIISQQPPAVPPETLITANRQDEVQLQKVIADPEDDNSIISTVPPSPSRILKEGDSEWINAEVADYSLSSLLGHLESPVKSTTTATSLTSNMASDLSNEVDAQLHSLLTENSVDFAANFADLAASVVSDKKF